ncbi:helix-turn-helix domain-containing protein [Klebsiella variicola]
MANFILRRTKMSRSYLFQVLSDLKNGGYITMKNGELFDIVNELPEKY